MGVLGTHPGAGRESGIARKSKNLSKRLGVSVWHVRAGRGVVYRSAHLRMRGGDCLDLGNVVQSAHNAHRCCGDTD